MRDISFSFYHYICIRLSVVDIKVHLGGILPSHVAVRPALQHAKICFGALAQQKGQLDAIKSRIRQNFK